MKSILGDAANRDTIVPLPDRAMIYPALGTQDLTVAERATGLP